MNIKKTMDKTMRKNQRVRILRTGELGTVADKVLIKRQGAQRPQLYCKVSLDKKPGEDWKSHATLTLLAKQDCPLWLQYD